MFIAYYHDSVNCTFEKRSALIKKRKEPQTSLLKHKENIETKWQ